MKLKLTLIALLVVITFSSCKIIVQDEVGVKRKLGKLDAKIIESGAKFYNPFLSRIITLKVRTVNIEMNLGLPSKEGLTVNSDISILYRLKRESVPQILKETGIMFEEVLIKPIFRSAAQIYAPSTKQRICTATNAVQLKKKLENV